MTESNSPLEALRDALVPSVLEAGSKIMEIYANRPEIERKEDGSPVTEADRAAEAIVLAALEKFAAGTLVISEESPQSHSLEAPSRFFLVDPLDGTKEFLKRDGKGSFTVNIALVEIQQPVMGIVYAPAFNRLFTGIVGIGAQENRKPIKVRQPKKNGQVAVASISHRDSETQAWLEKHNITETVCVGSSLKFCMLAAGEADIYPRFGPTMEWDTAAGHAVLTAAGGGVDHPNGGVFSYGKTGYRNGPFIAHTGQFDQL